MGKTVNPGRRAARRYNGFMSSRQARSILAAVAMASAALLPVSARQQAATQQQQPQQPTFRTGVRLVRVDVTATGKGDEPVSDLKVPDFEVTEDGILQKIEQLQFLKLDGQPPRGDDRSLEIRTQDQAEAEAARDDVRVFAVFLDDYHVDKLPAVTLPLRRALSRLVDRFWATDLVAFMDPLTPLSALRFTRSKAEMLDIVNKFEGRQGEIFPVKSAIEEAQLHRGDIMRVRAEVTLSALEALVVRLGGLREGRKMVIFVSQGPPTFFGRDASLQDRMRGIAQAASRGNVTIYPVDPRGLGMQAAGSRDTLFQLAAETGGRAITDTNDPMAGLSRVLNDASAYYVLGYQPTRVEDDGKYHKISVKVKRPGVHVLARQGYWAPSGKEIETARIAAAKQPEPEVARAMDTLAALEPSRRPADLWIGASRGEDGRSRVTVTWDPSEAGPGMQSPASSIDAELLDAQNKVVIEPRRTIAASGPSPTGRASVSYSLKPGPVTLRLTARAGDASLGTWVVQVTVPDFGKGLGLSTPRLYRARSLAELRAFRTATDAPSSATRRFQRSDRVLVALDCYAAPDGPPPTIEGHLLAKDGRELAPLAVPALEGTTLRFELPLTSLGQGTYILRIRARQGSVGAEQMVAFSIAG
jgi:VWFA-related protein